LSDRSSVKSQRLKGLIFFKLVKLSKNILTIENESYKMKSQKRKTFSLKYIIRRTHIFLDLQENVFL